MNVQPHTTEFIPGKGYVITVPVVYSTGQMSQYVMRSCYYASLVHSANCHGTSIRGSISRFVINGNWTKTLYNDDGTVQRPALVTVKIVRQPTPKSERPSYAQRMHDELTANPGVDMFPAELARLNSWSANQ